MHDDRADRNVTHVATGEGRSFWLATDLHVFKAVGEDTGGAFTLTELTVQPQFGPPPHVHHQEDESFYVLEGEFEFLDGERAITADELASGDSSPPPALEMPERERIVAAAQRYGIEVPLPDEQ